MTTKTLNFIEPPGNVYPQSVDCCPLSVDFYKKAFMSCFLQAWKLFFIDSGQQTIDYRLCPHCLVSEPIEVTSCLRQAQAPHTQGLLTVVRCPLT